MTEWIGQIVLAGKEDEFPKLLLEGFGQGLAEGFEAGYGLGCQEEKEAIVRRLLKESSVTMADYPIDKVKELAAAHLHKQRSSEK